MGILGLFFSVVAYNAPLVVVLAFMPVIVGSGNQLGAPMTFISVGALLAVFAAGFTKMARYLPSSGAFYAYVAAGLGKPLGLGTGFLAMTGYFLTYAGNFALAGISLRELIHNTWHGPDLPWWVLGLIVWALIAVLGYFRVDLSAKVLGVFLVGELLVTFIFDLRIFMQGGAAGFPSEPFQPAQWFTGAPGLAFLFGIVMFAGFEATAIYRDEVKNPEKTIPRATYLVVFGLSGLYAITAYLYIAGVGVGTVVQASAEDPNGTTLNAVSVFAGHFVHDIAAILLSTSIFATTLAGHNIVDRYIFNLSVDGILPRVFSKVHPKQGSPYVASILVSVAALVLISILMVAQIEPTVIYTTLTGVLGFTIMVAMLLTSISIPLYMRRNHRASATMWSTRIAPVVAAVGFTVTVVLGVSNFDLLVGGTWALAGSLLAAFAAIFVAGILIAVRVRTSRPDIYARIGRQ